MQILVFNAGSSSLKFGIFDVGAETREIFKGSYERFRDGSCEYRFRHGETDERGAAAFASPGNALKGVPDALKRFALDSIDAVGHRIVHGGARFSGPTLLDDDTVEAIATLTPLAPLHNPANLEAVRLCRSLWPNLPQVAVFDTAFHLTNPAFATTYAVPAEWRDAGLRRYGFHGLSHAYCTGRAAEMLQRPVVGKLIVCHLGNGCSVSAVRDGDSVDTSMGFTPLEGLVMGTRSGDLDPAVVLRLARELGIDEAEALLNQKSGLLGLS
nr:acetate/propionate family kinase [Pseudomonadota bacterium]